MKLVISRNAKIVTFFRASHYWGGQLSITATAVGVLSQLRTHSDSRWYTLVLQAMCIQEYRYVTCCYTYRLQQLTACQKPFTYPM